MASPIFRPLRRVGRWCPLNSSEFLGKHTEFKSASEAVCMGLIQTKSVQKTLYAGACDDSALFSKRFSRLLACWWIRTERELRVMFEPRFCYVLPAHGLRGDWDGVSSCDHGTEGSQSLAQVKLFKSTCTWKTIQVRDMFAKMSSALMHSKAVCSCSFCKCLACQIRAQTFKSKRPIQRVSNQQNQFRMKNEPVRNLPKQRCQTDPPINSEQLLRVCASGPCGSCQQCLAERLTINI